MEFAKEYIHAEVYPYYFARKSTLRKTINKLDIKFAQEMPSSGVWYYFFWNIL